MAKYSNETMSRIQNDLIQGVKSFEEIASEYNITLLYLSFINRGVARIDDNLDYPLRKAENARKEEEKIIQIEYYLLASPYSIEKLASHFNISDSLIYDINMGKHFWSNTDRMNYPIRNKNKKYSDYYINLLVEELKNNDKKMKEIEQEYSVAYVTLSRINQGKIYKIDDEVYPLRPSSKRVY